MDTIELDIPFDYRVTGAKKGSRGIAPWITRDLTPASIRVVESMDIRHFNDTTIVHGDRLFYKANKQSVDLQDFVALMTDDFRPILGDAHNNNPPFRLGSTAFGLEGKHFVPRGTHFREIAWTDRERKRAVAEAQARDLLIHEGDLYSASHAPVVEAGRISHAAKHDWRKIVAPEDPFRPVPVEDAQSLAGLCGISKVPSNIEDYAGIRSDFPAIEWHMISIAKSITQAILPHYGTAADIGSGAFFLPTTPEDLDESLFEMRRGIRSMLQALEYDEGTAPGVEMTAAALSDVAVAMRREFTHNNRMPGRVLLLADQAASMNEWWQAIEEPKRIAARDPIAEDDFDAVSLIPSF